MDNAIRAALQRGVVIPAHPLALDADGKFDERHQRALTRYYAAAGAGGIAVGVHTTQFAIRDPHVGLFEPVLTIAAEEMGRADGQRPEPMIRIGGICGTTDQALREADLLVRLGYHAGLLSLAALANSDDGALIEHCEAVAGRIPVIGFYLQPSVGGRLLSYGSGDGGDRAWLEQQGFDVTAFDLYPTPNTDVIADGHALPFAGGSFDVVATIAVLQQLPDPFRAMAEIGRVLRPGGVVLGTVAFLEPFSSGNHFNMSHLGVRSLLERSGLARIDLAPGWSSFEALSANFWPWGHSRAGRRLSLGWNRAKYRFGMALLDGMYRLRGKPAPGSLAFHFAGSLLFRAVKLDS